MTLAIAMPRPLLASLIVVVTSLAVSVAPPAAYADGSATAPATYDTVDAVEVYGGTVAVTGIISGQAAPSTLRYTIQNGADSNTTEAAARCDRLALLVIAKPGKYQLAFARPEGSFAWFSCKLIVRTP